MNAFLEFSFSKFLYFMHYIHASSCKHSSKCTPCTPSIKPSFIHAFTQMHSIPAACLSLSKLAFMQVSPWLPIQHYACLSAPTLQPIFSTPNQFPSSLNLQPTQPSHLVCTHSPPPPPHSTSPSNHQPWLPPLNLTPAPTNLPTAAMQTFFQQSPFNLKPPTLLQPSSPQANHTPSFECSLLSLLHPRGVIGLKPTFGRVSHSGVLPLNWTVGMVGILAGTIEDALIVYAAISAQLPSHQPTTVSPKVLFPLLKSPNCLSRVKLAKYGEWFNDCTNDIRTCCSHALQRLHEHYGWETVEVTIPEIEVMRLAHYVTIGSEWSTSIVSHLEKLNMAEIGWDARVALSVYGAFSSRDYINAHHSTAETTTHLHFP